MSPGVAIPWPAAPPMPMARSIVLTAHLLSERMVTFAPVGQPRSGAGPTQSCSDRGAGSRSPGAPSPGLDPLLYSRMHPSQFPQEAPDGRADEVRDLHRLRLTLVLSQYRAY